MFSNLDLVVSIRVAKIKYIRSAYFPAALKNNGLIIKKSFPLDDRQKKTTPAAVRTTRIWSVSNLLDCCFDFWPNLD